MDRSRPEITVVILIAITLIVATATNIMMPSSDLSASIYAVPMLLAARQLSTRGVAATSALSLLLHLASAYEEAASPWQASFGLIGLLAVAALAINLSDERRRVIERQHASEEAGRRINGILESITDGFFSLDREGRFVYINQQAERFMRQRRDELVGRSFRDVFPEATRLPFYTQAMRAYANRVAVHFEAYYPPLAVWFEAHIFPSDDGISVYFRDVTGRKRAEEALREAEAKYRSLVEQIPAVAYTTELVAPGALAGTGHASYISPQIEQLLGYTAEEWTCNPQSWRERIHPEDCARVVAENARVNQTGEPLRVEYRMLARDGRVVWISEDAILVRDSAGQPRCWQGILRDITVQKELEFEREAAARRVAFLAETSRDLSATEPDYAATLRQVANVAVPKLADWCMVYIEDESGQVRRAAMSHARPQDAALAARLQKIAVAWDTSSWAWRVLTRGQTLRFSTPSEISDALAFITEDQRDVFRAMSPGSVVFVPLVARGRTLGALLFIRRIDSPEYSADDMVFIEEVARRCALVVDNARLYREAREAVRTREEFLSVASHELRTPLTSIKGYVQLLDRRMASDPSDTKRLRDTMDKLRPHLERFERIIRDLLDVSRIQEGQLTLRPEPCDLAEIARDLFDAFQHSNEHDPLQPMHLIVPDSLPGVWDSVRVSQVIANLLSNALKYSRGTGEITLEVRREGDDALVIVHDRGIGMSADEQRRVFEPFFRADSVAGKISGTGLGLYITRRIVEYHGGTISVESTPGQGSTFIARLPCQTIVPLDGKSQPSPAEAPAASPTRGTPYQEQ